MRSFVIGLGVASAAGFLALGCAKGSAGADASTYVDAAPQADASHLPDATQVPDARPHADAAPHPDAAPPPDAPPAGCTLTEGFESGTVPPSGWTKVDYNATQNWQADNYSPHSGTWNAQVLYDDTLGVQDEVLISPEVTCTGATVTFWVAGSYYWSVDPETNYEGALWAVVGTWDGGSGDDVLITDTIFADLAVAQGGTFENFTWYQVSYPIPGALDNQPIKLAWEYYGADGAELALDDISLE